MEGRFAGIGHIVQHVSPLQSQGRHHRQDALHETAATRAVGAEAGLAPDHGMAHSVLRRVVRRLDTLDVHEGPERRLQRQDLAASSGDALGGTRHSRAQVQ